VIQRDVGVHPHAGLQHRVVGLEVGVVVHRDAAASGFGGHRAVGTQFDVLGAELEVGAAVLVDEVRNVVVAEAGRRFDQMVVADDVLEAWEARRRSRLGVVDGGDGLEKLDVGPPRRPRLRSRRCVSPVRGRRQAGRFSSRHSLS
jgi:hypothetical protein